MGKYKQLTYKERCQIESFLHAGYKQSEIAKTLGRSKSTIHTELNRLQCNQVGYNADDAQHDSDQKRLTQRRCSRKLTEHKWLEIERLLKEEWSPEQISGWLEENGLQSVSHEWIYQYIWKDKSQGGTLYQSLRHQGRKYYQRGASGKTKLGRIKNRVGIEMRPAVVDERSRVGDWEIDTIIGKSHQGAIVSIVERKTRFTCLIKVKDKSAAAVTAGSFEKLKRLKDVLFTITADNGKEFAWHQHLKNALDVDVYFARPYHSWERGTNENTNGLVRQYLPKGTDFTQVTSDNVQWIEDKLNNRPRKCLGFKTPKEMMDLALAA